MKKIVIGVTGSIAAYKVLEVIREFKKRGEEVLCVLTSEATKFVSPLSFSILSGNEVIVDFFKPRETPIHINLANSALILVAPSTYNFIGKVASGIADDPLSCIIAATSTPVVFAPCMDTGMWENPVLQENIKKLKKFGYYFIEPEIGELASLKIGKGRFPEPKFIVEEVYRILNSNKRLKDKKILVTAGRTEEDIDPIRCITNKSSGKMGYALAFEARLQGGDVTLISGPSSVFPPSGIKFVEIRTTKELKKEILSRVSDFDILIMTAAVADYTPMQYSQEKIKEKQLTISFEKTQDILKLAKKKNKKLFTVGFSLELEEHIKRAKEKLKNKCLDVIVSNDVSSLSSPQAQVTLIDKNLKTKTLSLLSKLEVAKKIIALIIARI